MCRTFGLDSRAASLTLISFNMTAVVCQLDKLVAAISQLAHRYRGEDFSAMREAALRPDRKPSAAFWHAIGSRSIEQSFYGSKIQRLCNFDQMG
jgi:hypothetical protein